MTPTPRPVRIAVLTLSDTRLASNDASGDLLVDRLGLAGHHLADRAWLREDLDAIIGILRSWSKRDDIECILTTGGTGVTGRDLAPEALTAIADKLIPGFGELFRWISYDIIGTSTIQSRAIAGVANGAYVFCLPGSTSACRDAWDKILAQQLDIRHKPCNFAELLPRLDET